jgi:lipoate-protein ligase A
MSELVIEPLHGGLGTEHMKRDGEIFSAMEALLRTEGADPASSAPVLRLYTWDEPTVSLGRSQKPEIALAPRWEAWNRDRAQDPDGPAAVVQRPTGGRAVWHEDELTYSVVFPLAHPVFLEGNRSPEEFFGGWLLEAGLCAGIDGLSLERGGFGRDPLGLGAAPCFASTSRHELKWRGLKWVGSARRLGQKALLQHGAIRLGPAGDRLESWLTDRAVVDDRPWSTLPSPRILADHLGRTLLERVAAA